VVLVLEPQPTETASGIKLVNVRERARASRTAIVVASGPGYWYSRRQRISDGQYSAPTEVFVPNETKAGDRVLVDADPGQDYRLDVNVPRMNGMGAQFEEMVGEKGSFRIVRESEIYAIYDEVAEAAE
jgi:hypothetical protein